MSESLDIQWWTKWMHIFVPYIWVLSHSDIYCSWGISYLNSYPNRSQAPWEQRTHHSFAVFTHKDLEQQTIIEHTEYTLNGAGRPQRSSGAFSCEKTFRGSGIIALWTHGKGFALNSDISNNINISIPFLIPSVFNTFHLGTSHCTPPCSTHVELGLASLICYWLVPQMLTMLGHISISGKKEQGSSSCKW